MKPSKELVLGYQAITLLEKPITAGCRCVQVNQPTVSEEFIEKLYSRDLTLFGTTRKVSYTPGYC